VRKLRNLKPSSLLGAAIVAALMFSGCGYHFASSGDALPPDARTIYVSRFSNHTRITGVNDQLMRYIKDEIALHRRLAVVDSPETADLELSGVVRFSTQTPANFNSALEPTQYNDSLVVSASLTDLHAKKMIWTANNISKGSVASLTPQSTVVTSPSFLQQNLRANDIAGLTDIQTAQAETSATQDIVMQQLAQKLYAEMAEGF
jgi:Lipopolysaccharide-assembly